MSIIGVIIPVYNVEKYIKRCIESVLAQTFTKYEIVLIDDGSIDDSSYICEHYSRMNDNIHVIHQTNHGAAYARNVGIDFVKNNLNCRWICFVDSDDCIHPQYLEILVSLSKKHNNRVAACQFTSEFNNYKRGRISTINTTLIDSEDFFCRYSINSVVPWAKIYPISFFDSIRFPVGKLDEDEFVTYRLIFTSKQIVYYDYPLYTYTENYESITHTKWIPQKMDYFEGVSGQISFFRKNNYSKALKSSVCWYAHFLHKQMETIKEQPEYKKYRQKMRRMFQRHLLKFGKKYLPFHENYNYYEDAFPHIMTIYWNYKGIKSKLKRNN